MGCCHNQNFETTTDFNEAKNILDIRNMLNSEILRIDEILNFYQRETNLSENRLSLFLEQLEQSTPKEFSYYTKLKMTLIMIKFKIDQAVYRLTKESAQTEEQIQKASRLNLPRVKKFMSSVFATESKHDLKFLIKLDNDISSVFTDMNKRHSI